MIRRVTGNPRIVISLIILSIFTLYGGSCIPIPAGMARIYVVNEYDSGTELEITGPTSLQKTLGGSGNYQYDVDPGSYSVSAYYWSSGNNRRYLHVSPGSFSLDVGKSRTVTITNQAVICAPLKCGKVSKIQFFPNIAELLQDFFYFFLHFI